MTREGTYLSSADVRAAGEALADEIRSFLTFLRDPHAISRYRHVPRWDQMLFDVPEDLKQAASRFTLAPDEFSTEALFRYGEDHRTAVEHAARIEIRTETASGAAQIGARGIYGPFRSVALKQTREILSKESSGLQVKTAGAASLEVTVEGVDKSLPPRYFASCWDSILDAVAYQPGDVLNARLNKFLLICDGDGTIYGEPGNRTLPTLAESPCRDSLNRYLLNGGLFLLLSGNNIHRTAARLRTGLSEQALNRAIVCANGGADLGYFLDSRLKILDEYRESALKRGTDDARPRGITMIYAGNDAQEDGNDYPAFATVGWDNAFLIGPEKPRAESPLIRCRIPGGLSGTAGLINALCDWHETRPGEALTSGDISSIRDQLRKNL